MVVRYSLRVFRSVPKCNREVIRDKKDIPMEIGLLDGWRNLTTLYNEEYPSYNQFNVALELQIPVLLPPVVELQPLNNELLSDCSLVVGKEVTRAHRHVLANHSEVFRAFFTSPMAQEAVDGVVNIKDFSVGSVKALVRFLYTGRINPEALEFKVELFKLSDKYLIDPLKKLVVRYLIDDTNEGNVLDMAVLADNHDSPLLLKACAFVVYSNHAKILASAKWKVLEKERPSLLVQLMKLEYGKKVVQDVKK